MQALWIALVLFVFPSQATTAVIHDIQTMTRKSEVVVEAKVIRQEVMEDAQGRIITLTTLHVDDGMKGAQTGKELTLYQIGGELNGRVMRLEGASVYRPGEQIMLFASPFKDKIVSYGLGLGKFNIITSDKKTQVIEDIHNIEFLQRKEGRQIFVKAAPRRYPSLKAFKDEIRKAL